MGLLADMLQRRYARQDRQEWADAMPGLMGSAGGQVMAGPPEIGQEGQPLLSQGHGLMGDPNSQGNQMEFLQGVMGLPGGAGLAVPQMFAGMRQEDQQAEAITSAAQAHQNQLERDSNQSMLSMAADQYKTRMTQVTDSMRNLRLGVPEGFKDLGSFLQSEGTFRKDTRAALQPYREPLERANALLLRLDELGGDVTKMTGADDNLAFQTAIKLLTKENVMSDDREGMRAALTQAPGMLQAFEAFLSGEGVLGPEQRINMFQSLGPLIRQGEQDYATARAPYEEAVRGRFDPAKTMRAPPDLNIENQHVRGLFGYEGTDPEYEYRTLPDGTQERRLRE